MKGFSIKTEIQEFDTFEQFAREAGIGENDLVLCGEHTFDKYIAPLNTGVGHFSVRNTAKANRQTAWLTQFLMNFVIRLMTV